MTPQEMIREIELKTGHTVDVGRIPGTKDANTIWACVDSDKHQSRFQSPGATAEEAIADLWNLMVNGEGK